jgi:hypothetical protein
MNSLQSRAARAVLVVVVLGGLLGYHFLYKVPQRENEHYQGTVTGKTREVERHPKGEKTRTFHLEIETEDGEPRHVPVPRPIWRRDK